MKRIPHRLTVVIRWLVVTDTLFGVVGGHRSRSLGVGRSFRPLVLGDPAGISRPGRSWGVSVVSMNVGEHDQRPVVYFIGSSLRFPATVVSMVGAELSEVVFARRDALPEAEAALDGRAVQAIVVDEDLLTESVLASVRARVPQARLVLAYRTPQAARDVLTRQVQDAQADIGFLPMNMRFDNWVAMLRLMICGEAYVPREILGDLAVVKATAETEPSPETSTADLTNREREVLALVAKGMQNKVIAAELALSEHTIKLHIHHVIAKLGVRNRTEAAAWFHQNGPAYDLSA